MRADDASGMPKIVGHGAVWDQETELWPGMHEVIRRGAFSKTLAEARDIKSLFNHDSNIVLGSTRARTLAIVEDERGLAYTIDPPATQLVRDQVIEPMRRGDISGSSFAFRVVKQAFTERPDGSELRELLEVELFEVSPVTFPAYEGAESQIRSMLGVRKNSEKFTRAAGLLGILRGEGLTDAEIGALLCDTSSQLAEQIRAAVAAREDAKARAAAMRI
jgi:hypothetical protein